ncbi:MAG: membrane-bound lytic murein transglycosylase MltF [Nitrospinae bacterium]|nr:membrane-bound lytic murein transglycosylase MltF [Nitrospinota bacterium]
MFRYIFLFSIVLFSACSQDYMEILSRKGTLTVVTRNNNFCYYSYRGEEMGFEYDLIHEFAKRNNLKIHVVVKNNLEEMVKTVKEGKADVIAANIFIDAKYNDKVIYTKPHLYDAEIVIINKTAKPLKKILDLKGKSLLLTGSPIQKKTAERLKEKVKDLNILIEKDIEVEDVFQMISDGEVYGTITKKMVFSLNQRYYPNLTEVFPVSNTIEIPWALNKKNTFLQEKLNIYLTEIIKDGFYKKTYTKYFSLAEDVGMPKISLFKNLYKERFSQYAAIVKKESKKRNIDWRLIAALMFQESHYKPFAKSYMGARGLMQLMPGTMKMLQVKNPGSIEENISAGIKYISILMKQLSNIPENQRIYFAIASYNIGSGHVFDAIQLTEEKGLNPMEWNNVAKIFPLLMKEEYYEKTKHGYCRPTETLKYLSNIMVYYDILRVMGQDKLQDG